MTVQSIKERKKFGASDYGRILRSTMMYYDAYADSYVSYYEGWPKGEGSFSDSKYKEGYETVAKLLSDVVKPNEIIVDVGCGVGVWSTLIAEKGAYVLSLDNLSKMLQKAKERFVRLGLEYKASPVLSNGFFLPFRKDSFDGATLNWVLAHIPAPLNEKFMNEVSRVVKRGGWLFFSDSYWRGQEGGKEQVQIREVEGKEYEVYKYYYELNELKGLIEKTFGKVEILQPLHYELICVAIKTR